MLNQRKVFLRTCALLLLTLCMGYAQGYAQAPTISTFAGNYVSPPSYVYNSGDENGPATSATLGGPIAVAHDNNGNVYFSDENHRIWKVNSSGNISTFAGTGTAGNSGNGSVATSATINYVIALEVYGGYLYLSDQQAHVIRRIDLSTNIITVVASGLYYPNDIAFDPLGDLVIGMGDNRIYKKNLSTSATTVLAGTGTAGYSGDGGPAISAALNSPTGLAYKGNTLYFTDRNNNVVRKIESGVISTVAGTGAEATSPSYGDDSAATLARFYDPWHLAIDGAGDIVVSDDAANGVRKFVDGGNITRVAGNYIGGYTGSGIATNERVLRPMGISLDAAKLRMYICDNDNNLVRMVQYANDTPVFDGGLTTTLNVCKNSTGNSISALLSVTDANIGQPLTWSIFAAPANGTVSGLPYTVTAASGTTVPIGITYTPTTGYAGTDAFTIKVQDGSGATNFLTVNVTVEDAGTITGPSVVTVSGTITLSNTSIGGTWMSSNTGVATIGTSSGIVTGVSAGTTTIDYIMPGGCYATAVIGVFGVSALLSAKLSQ